MGFWDCCCLAAFSYGGNDLIGISAHETERQRKNIPKAARSVAYRITTLYTAGVLILGLTVSANDPILTLGVSSDPIRLFPGGFIVMAERAGMPAFAHFINVVMLVAAISVASANLYFAVL